MDLKQYLDLELEASRIEEAEERVKVARERENYRKKYIEERDKEERHIEVGGIWFMCTFFSSMVAFAFGDVTIGLSLFCSIFIGYFIQALYDSIQEKLAPLKAIKKEKAQKTHQAEQKTREEAQKELDTVIDQTLLKVLEIK